MFSIYHFFKNLIDKRKDFLKESKLENFSFDESILASKSRGKFPDLSIRLNKNSKLFSGGELIELKDSDSYTVSSFNSTIPTGSKKIADLIKSKNSIIKKQMIQAGNDIHSLPLRDVYYLIRGKNKIQKKQKIVLAHGSFFETIPQEDLISQSFLQVLEERLKEKNITIKKEFKNWLTSLFSERESFSKVRKIAKASIKLRFRIMTEVKKEGNILNSEKYPEIIDNTINFLLPLHKAKQETLIMKKMRATFIEGQLKLLKKFKIKHHLNGYFLVFQKKI